MSDILTFCTSLLDALIDFFETPPFFYLFGVIIFAFVVKIVMTIIRPS